MPLNKDMRVSHFVTYLDCKQLEIFKGATKIFFVRYKNWRKHNQQFKLLFFTINLCFVLWNQVSSYRKLNLPITTSTYLAFLPLEMQRRLKQTKVYHTFFYFAWKETTHNPLKVSAAKALFSSVYVIDETCFDERF